MIENILLGYMSILSNKIELRNDYSDDLNLSYYDHLNNNYIRSC